MRTTVVLILQCLWLSHHAFAREVDPKLAAWFEVVWDQSAARSDARFPLYVEMNLWESSGLSVSEHAELKAKAENAPEGRAMHELRVLENLPRPGGEPVFRRTWDSRERWRLSVDHPGGSPIRDMDAAIGSDLTWARANGELFRIGAESAPPPGRDYATQGAQEARWNWAFLTGGLSFIDTASFERPVLTQIEADRWQVRTSKSSANRRQELTVRGTWNASRSDGTIVDANLKWADSGEVVRVLRASEWSMDLSLGQPVAHEIRLKTRMISAEAKLLAIRRPSVEEIDRVTTPPDFGREDGVRGKVVIDYVNDYTTNPPQFLRASGTNGSLGPVEVDHPVRAARNLQLTGWWLLASLTGLGCAWLIWRKRMRTE